MTRPPGGQGQSVFVLWPALHQGTVTDTSVRLLTAALRPPCLLSSGTSSSSSSHRRRGRSLLGPPAAEPPAEVNPRGRKCLGGGWCAVCGGRGVFIIVKCGLFSPCSLPRPRPALADLRVVSAQGCSAPQEKYRICAGVQRGARPGQQGEFYGKWLC